jgi:hypothetical protein
MRRLTKMLALSVIAFSLVQANATIFLGSVDGNKSSNDVGPWLDGLVSAYNANPANPTDLPYPPGPELFRVNPTGTAPVGSPPSGYWQFGANTLDADLSLLVGKYSYATMHWGGSHGGITAAYYIGDVNSGPLTFHTLTGNGLSSYSGFSAVPEPTTMIAGALLLLPFGASTLRVLRKNRA